MSFPAPPMPDVPAEQRAETTTWPRYEDVTQDGRLLPIAVPNHMAGIWQALAQGTHAKTTMASGVIPILTRMTMECDEARIRVDRQMATTSAFELAHSVDASGEVNRVYMNLWASIAGVPGRVRDTAPDAARVPCGRIFAEHTFTKLFAPPDQRKVTSLPNAGVPPTRYAPAAAIDLPEGATWLDEVSPDPTPVIFTLDQTDSNQHVNSLVYLRIFLDAAQRRFATLGRKLNIASRSLDITYRKPCFAGDHARIDLRAFSIGDAIGAAGSVIGDDNKPRCSVRAIFR
ncbi:MAG TPA: hypothetical protein VGM90_05635 [Kofleriaceae bacterium]